MEEMKYFINLHIECHVGEPSSEDLRQAGVEGEIEFRPGYVDFNQVEFYYPGTEGGTILHTKSHQSIYVKESVPEINEKVYHDNRI